MYINDVNILYYVLIGIAGVVAGWLVDYCNKIFLKEEKILSKRNFKEYIHTSKPNYILMIITTFLYVALLYSFGSTDLIKFSMYVLLIPMLLSAFVVDYKEQIIPNRLNLTMFEIGLVFVFLYGMTNLSISIDMLLGMLVGGGIFLLITIIGGFIAGKEAMGMRRCKTNGSIRFIFWICKHNNNIYNVISNRSSNKYITYGYKKE